MNREDEFDLLLADWLEEGPFTAPDRAIEAAIDYAAANPRRRRLPEVLRRDAMSKLHAAPIASHRFGHLSRKLEIGLAALAVLAIVFAATAALLTIRGAAPAAGPASTQTHIYWANSATGTIGRANLDGTGVNQSFVTGKPGMCGVLVVGDYLYWSNDDDSTIGRVRLDGTGGSQTLITDTAFACGLASDGTYLYWTNLHGLAGSVGRAGLDGSQVNQTFVEDVYPDPLVGITIGDGFIFWGAGENISCVRLDGRFEQNRCANVSTPPSGMAVVGNYIYWGSDQGTTISRGTMSVDATSVAIDADETFMSVGDRTQGLASEGTYLYWATTGSIGRANLDGTGINETFITGASGPMGVAIG